MRTILEIYFSIGFAIAGYQLHEDLTWSKDLTDKILSVFKAIFTLFIWCPFVVIVFGYYFLEWLFRPFQLKFWWHYFFTDRFYNIDKDVLGRICIEESKKRNSFKKRINSYCLKLVLKRNGINDFEKIKESEG